MYQKIILIFILLLLPASHSVDAQKSNNTTIHFTAYKNNYIIINPKPLEAKFQFSVKVKMFNDENIKGINEVSKIPKFLYFGYSQKSFWDLEAPSKPFSDHNFNPELFYLRELENSNYNLHSFQLGFEHESNGRDGIDTRSWDRAYIKSTFKKGKLYISPKLWIIADDEENTDIDEYLGYFDMGFEYVDVHNVVFEVIAKKRSIEMNISFPWKTAKTNMNKMLKEKIKRSFKKPTFNPSIFIQFWHGHGENLLNYTKKSSLVRFGFMFTH